MLEQRRFLNARYHVQIAGLRSPHSRLALPGQADPTSVADPRWDVDPQPPHRTLSARATARRAGMLDHRPGAVAVGARLGDREDPLALCLYPPAVADGANLGAGS